MKPKQIIIGAVLAIGIGVSIWLWTTSEATQAHGDGDVMAKMQEYTCKKCGAKLELTVKEAGEMRRNNDGKIICAQCGESDMDKAGAVVILSPTGFDEEKTEEETQTTESTEPAKPKMGTGRVKKNQ